MDHHSLMRKAWVNACHATLVFQIPCEDQCVVYLPLFTTKNQLNVGNLSYSDPTAMGCIYIHVLGGLDSFFPLFNAFMVWMHTIQAIDVRVNGVCSAGNEFLICFFLVQGQKFNEKNMTLKKQKSLRNSDILFYSLQGGPKKPRYKWSYEASISRVK